MDEPWNNYASTAPAAASTATPWNDYAPSPETRKSPSAIKSGYDFSAKEIGRQSANAARAVGSGLSSLVGVVNDPLVMGLNKAAKSFGSDFRFGTAHEAADRLLDAAGVPKEDLRNGLERGAARVEEGLAGTVGGIGVGKALAGSANAGVSALGRALSAAPGGQAAASTSGAIAGQLAQSAGGGAGAQTLAQLAGGMVAPGSGIGSNAVKGALRGGEGNLAKMEQTLADFKAVGATPTVGQLTGNNRTRAFESILAKTPGSGSVMRGAAEKQAQQAATGVDKIAGKLAPSTDNMGAGRAIERGINGPGGFIENFKTKSSELYDKVEQYLPKNTPIPAQNTLKTLAEITKPIKGMEQTGGVLMDKSIGELADKFSSDLQNNARMGRGNTVPYDGIKKLRTMIGDKLAGTPNDDLSRPNLNKLYGSLTKDMKNAAYSDPEAKAAWDRANTYYKAGQKRLSEVSGVVEKAGGTENIFKAATSGTKDGNSTFKAVMQSLPKDAQRTVSATIIRKLGQANPGVQNAEGDVFSMGTFLTNWNKLSPAARSTMIDRFGPSFRKNMDSLARVTDNVKSGSKYISNPSGTAGASANIGALSSAVTAAATGHPLVAAGIGALAGTANISGRAMTSPKTVNYLMEMNKRMPSQAGNVATTLNNLYRQRFPQQ